MAANTRVEIWERGGRWYVRRVSGGNVTDSSSYASRRSARRKARQTWPNIPIVVR